MRDPLQPHKIALIAAIYLACAVIIGASLAAMWGIG